VVDTPVAPFDGELSAGAGSKPVQLGLEVTVSEIVLLLTFVALSTTQSVYVPSAVVHTGVKVQPIPPDAFAVTVPMFTSFPLGSRT
jgi:hypothetical protein